MINLSKKIFLIIIVAIFCPWDTLLSQWTQQPFPTTEDLFRVRFVDSMTGWVLGSDFIYKTTDGGTTWVPQDTSFGFGVALFALNANVAFYANYASSTPHTRGIRRTTDGGANWETVDSSLFLYKEFELVNEQIGYAAGGDLDFNPMIKKTTDGGTTWTTIASDFSPSYFEITGISFLDEMQGWAVTFDALIFNTKNGGTTWTLQDSIRPAQPSGPLRDIEFTTPDSGWAVGGIAGSMLIARTIDGGDNWSHVVMGGSSLREVTFLNSQLGWIAGSFNSPPYILMTTDGGENWETQPLEPPSNVGFESISMVNENLGWTVGRDGQIYKTTTGGVVSVTENPNANAPKNFVLQQNYPNPFNPTTTIRYDLPVKSEVTLSVFNVLGQEVLRLVDKAQPAGRYAVQWDGRNKAGVWVSSGVYFFKLKTEKFTRVNKMLLVR